MAARQEYTFPTSSFTTSFDKRLLIGGIEYSDNTKAASDQWMIAELLAKAIISKPSPLLRKPIAATSGSGTFQLFANFMHKVRLTRATPLVMAETEFHELYCLVSQLKGSACK